MPNVRDLALLFGHCFERVTGRGFRRGALASLLICYSWTAADAQILTPQAVSENSTASSQEPIDPLGRSTPRSMIKGFLTSISERDFRQAAEYFSLDVIPLPDRDATGARLAESLQTLLDRNGRIYPDFQISDLATGRLDDRLAIDRERIGLIWGADEVTPITLEKRPLTDETSAWLFSAEFVRQIPALLANSRTTPLDRILPPMLQRHGILGVQSGHWLAVFALAGFSLAVGWFTTTVGAGLLRILMPSLMSGKSLYVSRAILLPLGLIIAVLFYHIGTMAVGISIVARSYTGRVLEMVAWLATAWLVWRALDGFADASRTRIHQSGRMEVLSAVTLGQRAGKAAICVFAAIAILGSFGVNVTTGLAAVGIGGLALALGAQKTIENFVGSLTLVADRPVRTGDFCRFGTTLGTVEDIGMRSTRIRTLSRTVVSIPNGAFSSMEIENYSKRDRFLFHHQFCLPLSTPAPAVRELLGSLRALISNRSELDHDGERVCLISPGRDALILEIFVHVTAKDYNVFAFAQEAIILDILDVMSAEGIVMALPESRVVFADSPPAAATGSLA